MKITNKILLGVLGASATLVGTLALTKTLTPKPVSETIIKEETKPVLVEEKKKQESIILPKKTNLTVTKFEHLEENVLTVTEEKETFTLNLNETYERGTIHFLEDGKEVSSISKQEGDKVTLKIDAKSGYVAKEIQVYSATSSLRLEVVKEETGIYSFVIPSKTIKIEENEIANPFYSEGLDLKIEVVFGLSNIGKWVFNYDKDGFGTYTIQLNEDLLLSDLNEELSLKSLKVEDTELIRFKIEMNGHNLTVGEFTVPSKCSLIFSNKTSTNVTISALNEEARLICNGSIVQDDLNIFNQDLKDQYGSKFVFVN